MANLSKNLTILYDGDAAGIKAALRGLDMALEQSFRVRLVLLPEGEDPDSFIQNNGSAAFLEYIEKHKRDVIDFHLEIGLKEAGKDPIKKAGLVSEIAETISKINKADDFTLQQYYIRECASRLDIEEDGLISLVNKFIREKAQKELKQLPGNTVTKEPAGPEPPVPDNLPVDMDAQALLTAENKEEWQLLQMLLEYGTRPFAAGKTVAQHFFETIDLDILEDALAKKMATLYYRYWQENDNPPGEQFFIKHQDKNIRHKAVDLFYEKYTPSPDWKEKFKIEIPFGDEIYLEEVKSGFAYFELKFIRRMIVENATQIKNTKDENQLTTLMKIHLELKKKEKSLIGVVIMK
jgi:DNA primase